MTIDEITSGCQCDYRQTKTERLTLNDLNKVCYDPWELCGMDNYCKKGCHEEGGCTKGCHILKMYRKLAMYEDLEERGQLAVLPVPIGTDVYAPCAYVGTWKWYVDKRPIKLEDVGRIGECVFLTEEEAQEWIEKNK